MNKSLGKNINMNYKKQELAIKNTEFDDKTVFEDTE